MLSRWTFFERVLRDDLDQSPLLNGPLHVPSKHWPEVLLWSKSSATAIR